MEEDRDTIILEIVIEVADIVGGAPIFSIKVIMVPNLVVLVRLLGDFVQFRVYIFEPPHVIQDHV